jgi:proteasome beta subunit
VVGAEGFGDGLGSPFTGVGSSSFMEFLRESAPELLPGRRPLPPGSAEGLSAEATTIVAMTFADGALIAGDRRATMGNLIAQRDVEKVHPADDYSAVGYAGSAGIAVEMVRLFQVELEHYEKLNETALTLEGKANRLSIMVRQNLGLAMQGLAALPLFVGYDLDIDDPARAGRIFSYDVTGGCFEERGFHGVGSGSLFAKSALKRTWRADLTADEAVRVAVDALYDAADEDSATGGPDTIRRLFPTMVSVTAQGAVRVPQEQIESVAREVSSERGSAGA